jgi:hypothetical protein
VPCANKRCKSKKIYGHIFKYVCVNCKGNYHGGCTGMSPDVLEQMKADPETNTWTCPTCIDELAKSEPTEKTRLFRIR